jgi:ComF family protein
LKYEQGLWLQHEITALLKENSRWREYFEGASLIPVPLHPRKECHRGYNQAEIITRAIATAFPGISQASCLKRVRETPSQTFFSREERLKNMRGAFTCREAPPKGQRLVVVDDVLTTGATLNAAVSALKEGGGIHISAFTLSHG